MSKKKSKHYVNNADFLAALSEYQLQVQNAKDAGEEIPIIPRYIGESILQIATRLSFNPNFVNYTYRDEMIADGIENAIAYGVSNFNPQKSKNPFAYFTQIIYYAFLRRIAKEKKALYAKHKVIEHTVLTGEAYTQGAHGSEGSTDYIDLDNEYMSDFVEKYEETLAKKKAQNAARRGLEKLVPEETPEENEGLDDLAKADKDLI